MSNLGIGCSGTINLLSTCKIDPPPKYVKEVGHEEENTWVLGSLYCLLSQLHFTDQPYCKNCRSAKVKDGIKNLILKNYLVDGYNLFFEK